MNQLVQRIARRSLTVAIPLTLTVVGVLGTTSSANAAPASSALAAAVNCSYLYNELRTAPASQKPLIIQEIREYCS